MAYSLNSGGAENIVATLATQVDSSRFDSEVASLTSGGQVGKRLTALGIPVHVLGKRPGIDLRVVGRLRKLLTQGDYSVVHTHNAPPNLWTIVARGLRRRPRVILTLHSPSRGAHGRLELALRNLCGLGNSALVGVSRMVTESHRKVDPFNRGRYRTLYNGIDALPPGTDDDRARLIGELKLPEDAILVGTVGNLRPPKAHSDLLEALAILQNQHPRLHMLVAGEGELRDTLAHQATTLGLGRTVHWLGSRSDVGALLAVLDLFVLSSRREGLPLALLEAMAAGVPVVSTDVGGISEVIQDSTSGRLVPAADPPALAAAIDELIRDPTSARRFAHRARERFEEEFTASTMVRNVEKLYNEVLAEKGARP